MSTRRLASDAHGAIALIGLLMAVFLCAAVYYVVGIGDAVLQRERMQDAADALAFSSAVLHARGMNVIVLINMVMAALLAVLVALKLVELLTSIAIVAIAISSFFAPGLAGWIPPLAQLRQQVQSAHDAVRPSIDASLEALHATARGVRVLVPVASQLRAIDALRAHYDPPAQAGVALPPRASLPTEDGEFATLCAHAGDYVGGLAGSAIGTFVPGAVAHIVAGAIGDLAKSRADWFCGAGGSPPETVVKRTLQLPELSARTRCKAFDPSASDYAAHADEQAELCSEAELDEAASEPDEKTGACQARCDADGPYQERAERAREACAPPPPGGRDHQYAFSWQERRFARSYVREKDTWVRASSDEQEERSARYRLHEDDAKRPCGVLRAAVSEDWNPSLRDPHSGRALPVCSNAAPPTTPARIGATRRLVHVEVTTLFGCKQDVEQRYGLDPEQAGDHFAPTDTASKAPQVLPKALSLGERPFQLQALVVGALPPPGPSAVMEFATFEPRDELERRGRDIAALRSLGRISLAQAEYYFAVDHRDQDTGAYMWSMRWQARLRRFQLPDDQAPTREQDGEPALTGVLGAATSGDGGESIFGSLHEACAVAVAAAAAAARSPRTTEGAAPCAALDRVLATEIAH